MLLSMLTLQYGEGDPECGTGYKVGRRYTRDCHNVMKVIRYLNCGSSCSGVHFKGMHCLKEAYRELQPHALAS